MEIKNLIFDYGKVLVDYEFLPIVRNFFDNEDEMRQFMDIFTSQPFINECDQEDVPFEQIICNKQMLYPQFARQLEQFRDSYVDFVTGEIPGMKETLVELKERGFKLYGLTNWCSKVYDVMPLYDIFQLLDGMLISSDVHLIKPDPAIYLCLCQKYGLKPQECVFTDDKPINVQGARKVGMQGIVFHSAKQYRDELSLCLKECESTL